MAEATIANTAQRDYWNSVAGPRWLGLEGYVERRVEPVNALLLSHARAARGERVLEIGCGTGAFTMPLAQAVGEEGEVVGADISTAMLDGAKRRLAASGLKNVSLIETDAQTHRFAPGRFDLIVSRFGVMFFADPHAAFANLLPSLRPGGRLCFVCWGGLDENEHWLVPYRVALKHLGSPEPRPPRAPGPMAFADPDYVREFLARAGFGDITIEREHPHMAAASIEEEADAALLMGPSARLIDEKNPEAATREAIRREIAEALAAVGTGGQLSLPATVLLVSARRP
jgi:SAM-dependent methyltransferase